MLRRKRALCRWAAISASIRLSDRPADSSFAFPRPSQPSHRSVSTQPRSNCGEADIHPVARIADHRKCGEQIPRAAPRGCVDAPPRGYRRREHHIDRIGRRRRCYDSQRQPWLNRAHRSAHSHLVGHIVRFQRTPVGGLGAAGHDQRYSQSTERSLMATEHNARVHNQPRSPGEGPAALALR